MNGDGCSRARPPAVVCALSRELAPLARRARIEERVATTHGRFHHARLAGRALLLGATGDGLPQAADALRSLLDRSPPGRLLFLGVAGGLAPTLDRGQLVAAGEVRDERGPAPPPDRAATRRALAVAGTVAGRIYSAHRIVATAAAKARLWDNLGRPEGAVVDLETAAWARLAAGRGIPYVAVRAVSDGAGDDLPLDFERLRDRRGQVRTWRVALAAVRRPWLILPLHRLGRSVGLCARRLASFAVDHLFEEI